MRVEPQGLVDELLASKAAFTADKSDSNKDRRAAASRALCDWRNDPANAAQPSWAPNVFRGADAQAFLPESEGGDDARALQLVTGALAAAGDTTTDPAAELARTRENF